MVSFSASSFETLYRKIVTLARVAINRPIVNLGDFKTFSCYHEIIRRRSRPTLILQATKGNREVLGGLDFQDNMAIS